MNNVKAIGFDLFNTLITVEPRTLDEAVRRLTKSLGRSGFSVEYESFERSHREAVMKFLREAEKDGRESHNRFWISEALEMEGYNVSPHDPRIARSVDAYFSAFSQYCHIIPGTIEMLGALRGRYRLALLSNLTHAPVAREIINRMGITPFLDAVLISGELGYRKPHPLVFNLLIKELGVEKSQVIYVGDDPEADINGALRAGLLPIWTTYVRDRQIGLPGYLSGDADLPDSEVPRISDWKEFLSLLHISPSAS